jgi:hypothetical protein
MFTHGSDGALTGDIAPSEASHGGSGGWPPGKKACSNRGEILKVEVLKTYLGLPVTSLL